MLQFRNMNVYENTIHLTVKIFAYGLRSFIANCLIFDQLYVLQNQVVCTYVMMTTRNSLRVKLFRPKCNIRWWCGIKFVIL